MSQLLRAFLPAKFIAAYIVLVGVPLGVLLLVMQLGQRYPSASPVSLTGETGLSAPVGGSAILVLLLQMSVIILLSRVVGDAMERIRQPRVIGEIVAGLLLGPSLLGWAAPGVSRFLFPSSSMVILNAISQLGLILFMFIVGLELNLRELRDQGHVAAVVSHASITTPMALGATLALYIYPRVSDPGVAFSGFALFMGVAMSITAFPVLARILSERGLLRTRMGAMAVACAAVDDVTGWCVLAYVVAFVRSSQSSIPLWVTVACLPAYLVIMIWPGRKVLRRIARPDSMDGDLPERRIALLLVFLMGSALVTEILGLHLLFGAFIAGAIMPKESGLVSCVEGKFHAFTVLLMPLFFAYTGLRTSIGAIQGSEAWGICLLIIAVAVLGKLGGAGLAGRMGGLSWRESLALGTLMNTRGLMELVVLNIGLEIKVISPQVFSMMVLMAIVTTMMAAPLLELACPKGFPGSGVTDPARKRMRVSPPG